MPWESLLSPGAAGPAGVPWSIHAGIVFPCQQEAEGDIFLFLQDAELPRA